ncbi:histidine kinase [Brevibacillus parabrevis]|uniref:sensor histidine kinase n=1 Tax=Brevibacillus parabrevis TaxID=54914 RepID=UPI0007ABFD53|nr:HAMP domain-containing sensor histidine kinase [Brevibacillus parabrevis]KZE43127.1 histidine kinase [Brevibacillus parabrevis]
MSIRIRLLISYIMMSLIPLVIFFLAIMFVSLAYFGDFRITEEVFEMKIGYSRHDEIEQEEVLDEDDIFAELKVLSKFAPYKLQDPEFIRATDKSLNTINAGLIIRNQQLVTYTSPFLKDPAIISALPEVGSSVKKDPEIRLGSHFFYYKQLNYRTEGNELLSIYLLKDLSSIEHATRKYYPLVISALLFALILTNGGLTFFVSRSIIRPIYALKGAAEKIKNGNFDHGFDVSSNDEIGELGAAFEEMRKQLKSSRDMQTLYEVNRRELISNISHDLKTPIMAIKGYVQGIQDGVARTPEQMNRYLKVIYKKVFDMDRLVDDLFLFSKLDLKQEAFSYELVELQHYLYDCIEELQLEVSDRGIVIERIGEPQEPLFVLADRNKLKRVITNIIWNSVKYMDKEEGYIGVRTNSSGEMVTIDIGDNGPGIEADELPFIFKRFYRVEQSRNTNSGGSGLGLSIAQQIIHEHGGTIWATSERGNGTIISFTLKKAVSKEGEGIAKDSTH